MVSEEATFTPDIPNLSAARFGWCMTGNHDECPAVTPAQDWPDPSRKGAKYRMPEHRCPCFCHRRLLKMPHESKTQGD